MCNKKYYKPNPCMPLLPVCISQDPNARNCHGYRKFVKRSILEDPSRGYLVNDTVIIKYTIELVVSTGACMRVYKQ